MTRPTVADALREAERAHDALKSHEDICAERYKGIETAQAGMQRTLDHLVKKQEGALFWTIATLVTMLGGAVSMIFTLMTK